MHAIASSGIGVTVSRLTVTRDVRLRLSSSTERMPHDMEQDQSDIAARAAGRYEILRRIGRGGMATVYLARQPGLDRDVALKELERFNGADKELFASRFLREAKLAGSLNHPNIVTVLDYFEHDGRPYIAMEYLEGGNLREYLHDLSMAQIMGVLEGLLAALTHAESRHISHRDIKPENILVTGEGNVKLTDFGIARAYNAALTSAGLTAVGTTVGTPKYMSPEQGTGKTLTAGSDLYAVGVVAYEMLVGHVPFDSEDTPLAIVWQHANDPVPDPRETHPDLDPRLCRWLEEMLAKDPADRPPSASAALDALEEIVLDLLGGRWRRAARLAAPQVTSTSARPLTPARVEKLSDDGDPPAGISLDDEVERGYAATREPLAQADRTGAFRPELAAQRNRDAAASASSRPRPQPGRRTRARTLAAVAVLAIVAAILGYALIRGDGPAERRATTPPVPAKSAAEIADAAARPRYIAALTPVAQRLGRAQADTVKRLKQAKSTAGQARIARLVAEAYRDAAADLRRLTPAASQAQAAARVRVQLRRIARDYSTLAAAAKAHGPKRYTAARAAIVADEKRLNELVAALPS
jgi:serine/threonine protein kinase